MVERTEPNPPPRATAAYSERKREGRLEPKSAQRAAHQERSACLAISSPSGPFSMRRSSRKR